MDCTYFFNLRSLAKRDLIIKNLEIDLAELKADKTANVMTDLIIKKKSAELEIELQQKHEFVIQNIKPSPYIAINNYVSQYYNDILRMSTINS